MKLNKTCTKIADKYFCVGEKVLFENEIREILSIYLDPYDENHIFVLSLGESLVPTPEQKHLHNDQHVHANCVVKL